jgi:branched-chain amino acid transport system ATP-binding protein
LAGAVGTPILAVRDVTVRFGGIIALDGVSFDIEPRQIVGLIGPNGAGKTTMFNCLSRLYQPTSGSILFEGQDLLRRDPGHIAGLGIGRTFQNLALFSSMTVWDNVLVGAHCRTSTGFLSNALRLPRVAAEEKAQRAAATEVLRFMDLEPIAHAPVAGLPFATLKRVETARALAARPKLLLLDEPAGGLNHGEVEALGGLIRTIRDRLGITVLLVEHHMNLVMQVSDKVVVLDFGKLIAEGPPAAIQRHQDVVKAYLGE